MSDLIGITGATGALGGQVAALLAERGVAQRLVVRDAARAPQLPEAEVREAPGGYAAADELAAGLSGVGTLLLVSAAEAPDRLEQHHAAVDAAIAAGVRRIVYTSFLGAAADCTFTLGRDHFHTEERIRGLDVAHTFLRDSFYLDFMPALVGPDGVVRGPAGRGRLAAVARADVAACAAAVLTGGGHENRTYDLTGPETFSLAEAAALMAALSGKPISFHDEAVQEAFESRMAPDVPDFLIDAWVTTYLAIKNGEVDVVSGDVEALTGRRPASLRELLERTPGALDHVVGS